MPASQDGARFHNTLYNKQGLLNPLLHGYTCQYISYIRGISWPLLLYFRLRLSSESFTKVLLGPLFGGLKY